MTENKEKINMTDTYTTTDGRKVRIYAIDGESDYLVHGAVYEGKWVIKTWNLEGFYIGSEDSCYNLIKVSPYADWPIDAKVWVWNDGEEKKHYHFAGINSEGYPITWHNGKTSWSAINICQKKLVWDHAELAE